MGNEKKSTEAKLELSSNNGADWVEITLPVLTVSEANGGVKKSYKRSGKTCYKSEHWTDKHRRHKRQKGLVRLMLTRYRDMLKLPCHITLTRFAPNTLDRHDNLPMSLKWILDACCEIITGDYRAGRADNDERINVSYKQVVSKQYAVNIHISF